MRYTLDFSLRRIVYDLIHHFRLNVTDSTRLSERQVEDWVRNVRAQFLTNDVNKGKPITDDFKQDFCLTLEAANASECCDVSKDYSLLKSVETVPTPVYYRGGAMITRVSYPGVMDMTINFSERDKALYSGNGRFNRTMHHAFLHNNRMYIKGGYFPMTLEKVYVQGVFDTPEQAAHLKQCSGDPCWTKDSRYPISRSTFEYMKNAIVEKMGIQRVAGADYTNDANDKIEYRDGAQN